MRRIIEEPVFCSAKDGENMERFARILLAGARLAALAGMFSCAARTAVQGRRFSVGREPLGLAYSGDGVNTAIFRVGAIETAGEHQFVTYYAPDGRVVVGHRKAGQAQWDLAVQNFYGRVSDAHNVVVLGVSSDGIVHLAYDHHGDALNYRVSGKPFDNRSFGERRSMTGRHEDHVTYPQFMRSPEGTLYFFYRDGKSGNGSLCLNRYDVATQSWKSLQHP